MSEKREFLSRWSQRKRGIAEQPEEDKPQPDDAVETAEPEPELRSDEDILRDLGLKHPDEMKAGDDFKSFLNSAVPSHLRRLALRKLWLTNPTLANIDGLVEYGEDYTDAAMVVENLQTAYQVGKGMLRKAVEVLEDEPGTAAAEVVADDTPEEDPEKHDTAEPEPVDIVVAEAEHETDVSSPRRRMRFEFTDK